MKNALIITRRLIAIPCRVAQLVAHVPLLVGAAALTWIRSEGLLCPVNEE